MRLLRVLGTIFGLFAVSAAASAEVSLQEQLDQKAASGGGVVSLPPGEYEIRETLRIPRNVTLEGEWGAPVQMDAPLGGTVLLGFVGKGEPEGAPLIKMGSSSTLKGVTIFYPEQTKTNPPIPYSWTVQSDGETANINILDVMMVNPYQAVDLGTYPAGRHLVRNLHAHALYRGIYVNQCYDVGRLENIHFWPYWDASPDSPLRAFTETQGEAFVIGKTDGEMGYGLFSIFYKIGMRFIEGPIYDADRNIVSYQAGSGMYTNCYSDVSPCAIQVDAAMESAGISFVNASIMSHVRVMPTNRGPVKFSASGFWATAALREHALLEGRGTVFFDACHFNNWDREGQGAYCIEANNRRLFVTGCDFPSNRKDHGVLRLRPGVCAAVVTGNIVPRGAWLNNEAPASAAIEISGNISEPDSAYISTWQSGGVVEASTPEAVFALGPGAAKGDTAMTLQGGAQGKVDLNPLRDPASGVPAGAFARVWLYSPKAQSVTFEAGFNDSGKLWVEGTLVLERFSPRGGQCRPGDVRGAANLAAGWSEVIVLVVDQGGKAWEFVLEAYGEDGEPVQYSATPDAKTRRASE